MSKSGFLFSFSKILSCLIYMIGLTLSFSWSIDELRSNQNESFRAGEHQLKYLEIFEKRDPLSDASSSFPPNLPDSSAISDGCPKTSFFYDRNPKHMKAIYDLQEILLREPSVIDAISLAGNLRNYGEIHPKVWVAAVIGMTESRRDMRHLEKPALVEIMPDRFISSGAIKAAQEAKSFPPRADEDTCIMLDERFGQDNGAENALWYFREDLMINSFHWYWHKSFPTLPPGRIRADRRGELFYYIHHHILARYDAERLAAGFRRVAPLTLQTAAIMAEGYYAHLNDTNSNRPFTDRNPNTPLLDINFAEISGDPNQGSLNVADVAEFRDRIEKAIDAQNFTDSNGNRVSLQSNEGIDMLGDIVEASTFSRNRTYFSSNGIHNNGHILIAFCMSAEEHRDLPPGPMADTSTSMRDMIFFRWHKLIDDVFDRHKQTLPPHTPAGGDFPLLWKDVTIGGFRLVSPTGRTNILNTFYSLKTFDISRGLDLSQNSNSKGPNKICAKHLNHEEFSYQIDLSQRRNTTACVRIFMAPRYNETGQPFILEDQRKMFFILDMFHIELNSNRIIRRSGDSTLTIPFARSLQELQTGNPSRPYCGCGWPHHLMIPKGNSSGCVYDVVVMITDAAIDNRTNSNGSNGNGCLQAPVLCGIKDERYPYRAPMGYPFDRPIYDKTMWVRPNIWEWVWVQVRKKINTIEEYVSDIPNMALTQVTVFHNNIIQ